jgi:hypothetical protein
MTKAFQIPPAACDGSFSAAVGMAWTPSNDFIYQEKINGARALLQVRPNGAKINYLTGRRVSRENGLLVEFQDQFPFIRDHQFPQEFSNSVVDGELADGVFWYFDVIIFNGRTVMEKPLRQRLQLMEKLGSASPIWLRAVPQNNHPAEFLKRILGAGGEGMVRKKLNETYGFGWSKVKFQESHDVIVLSVDAANRQMKIGQWKNRQIYEVGTVANLTEADAKVAAAHIGEVAEIVCQTRDRNGRFHRPVLFRWRADKSAVDCVFDAPSAEAEAPAGKAKSGRLPLFGTGTAPRPA